MAKYSWPLPGEGVASEELMMTEARTAIAGIANYSSQARRDAILAELIAALFNGQAFPSAITVDAVANGQITVQRRLGVAAILLTSNAGSAIAVDASVGTYFSISVNSTGGYTINNPTNLFANSTFQQPVFVEVHNNSGGAITTTWSSAWHLAGAWVDPGNGKSRFATFLQLNSIFQEISRSVADT